MNAPVLSSRAQRLYDVEELSERIRAGGRFFVAADEAVLRRLPKGDWVGGTIPYFMADDGGLMDRDRAFATELPACAAAVEIKAYGPQTLFRVYLDAPENGFSLIVLPAGSRTHSSFALNALRYDGFASRPLIGWVAGCALSELGRRSALVFDGRDGSAHEDAALVMHAALPATKKAEVGLINIFEPGDGDELMFLEDGFAAKEVLVGGVRRGFAEYAREKGLDTRLPLVADRHGVMVNTSFQGVDSAAGEVRFYAPVFKGVRYRQARPVGDYVEAFASQVPRGLDEKIAYSCNCVLNYLYADLEGRRTDGVTGPFTFGEIAYQLLNQTLVYLTVSDASVAERLRADPLQRQYRFLEAMIDAIPSPLFYKDGAGRYLGCNKAYEEFFGRPKSRIIGQTVRDFLSPELADAEGALDAELLSRPGREPHEHLVEAADAAGRPRSLLVRKVVFSDEEGRAAGIIGVLSDITESRRSERRLAAAYEDLKSAQDQLLQSQKMAAVGRLAGGVAHEINNPLAVILGFAQSARSALERGEDLALPLESIEREALRCRGLVQDLLVFSRASSGDRFAETDLNAVVEASLTLVAPRARIENSSVRFEPAGWLPRVSGNANQLQQVVVNLAGNALDAMPEGGTLELSTRLSPSRPETVELLVKDSGSGIPAEIRSKIFEPFFTTKGVGKGTGLGLALVYEIVRKHGGDVSVESEVGKGTTFVVSLPVRPAT